MEDLQKHTSQFSRTLAKSSFAFVALIFASVILIALIVAVVTKFYSSNSAQSISALVNNPALKDWSVTVEGTVKKIDKSTITISAKNSTFSFTANPTTLVNVQTPATNGTAGIPSLQQYTPQLLHVGDHIQATIASTDSGPKTTVITVTSSTAKIDTSVSTSGNIHPAGQFGDTPPPLPPKAPKSIQQSTSSAK